jgi:hypothetical protein
VYRFMEILLSRVNGTRPPAYGGRQADVNVKASLRI